MKPDLSAFVRDLDELAADLDAPEGASELLCAHVAKLRRTVAAVRARAAFEAGPAIACRDFLTAFCAQLRAPTPAAMKRIEATARPFLRATATGRIPTAGFTGDELRLLCEAADFLRGRGDADAVDRAGRAVLAAAVPSADRSNVQG